jgi:CBS domain-containing protein
MSARAAWRLDSLGFTDVYDYAAGKADWRAVGLPTEGPDAAQPRAGQAVQRDVPTCALSDRIGEVRDRVRSAGWDACVVVNAESVVLGLVRGEAFAAQPESTAEAVMEAGPTTARHDEDLPDLVERLRAAHATSILVTTSDGRLMGLLRRSDAEQRLAESMRPDGQESSPSQG